MTKTHNLFLVILLVFSVWSFAGSPSGISTETQIVEMAENVLKTARSDELFSKLERVDNYEPVKGNYNAQKSDSDMRELEHDIERLINLERTNLGYNALKWNKDLREIAYAHSADMARNNYFKHTNLRGQDANDRGNSVDYGCQKYVGNYILPGVSGENLMYLENYEWDAIAVATVEGWMNSPGHRENLLNQNFEYGAIGVAFSGLKVYITHNFSGCETQTVKTTCHARCDETK